MALDMNQLMQFVQLASSLGGGASAGGQAGGNVGMGGVGGGAGGNAGLPQTPPQAANMGQNPGVGGGQPGGVQPPTPVQQQAPAEPLNWWDRSAEWLSGGMKGDSPDAIADRENFRRYNTIMSLGTALGGAVAGGDRSGVGQVSNTLNQYAQGNIMASNAQEKEGAMNKMMTDTLGAIRQPGAATQQAPGMMPQAGGQGQGVAPAAPPTQLSSAAPIAPPVDTGGTGGPAQGGEVTVADLEKRMQALFG